MPVRSDLSVLDSYQNLAARLASDLHLAHPDLFLSVPVKSSAVAARLGLVVEQRRGLIELGRYFASSRIHVRRGLTPAIGRFVVAHEIGHALLDHVHPDVAGTLPRKAVEVVADLFATELLFPPDFRIECRDKVRNAQSPSELVKIANQFGVTPSCLLDFVSSRKTWLEGTSQIWLRIKLSPNLRKGGDIKLRVVSVHADSDRYFVPKNSSADRILPNISLAGLPIGVDTSLGSAVAELSVRSTTRPLYRRTALAVEVRCMHLYSSFKDSRSYYLVLLDPK